MDIVIVTDFYGIIGESSRGRFQHLADKLTERHNVEIITSDFCHEKKQHYIRPYPSENRKLTILHEIGYKKNISIKRILAHALWGRNVANYLKKRKKPDVIYCAIPTLTAAYLAGRICCKRKIKFIIDIQDLWPEAFMMLLKKNILNDLIFLPVTILSNAIYKQADGICAVSDTYGQRALKVNRKCKRETTVYLGTELSLFNKSSLQEPILKKNINEIWIGYCGTLGSSYDLTCVIDALHIINDKKIKFIVMGDGPREKEFRDYAKKKKVNVIFTGRIKHEQVRGLLSICDIAVNPITHNAAQSIINKHADYAAAGLPVISTQESEEYQSLVVKYNMGWNCKNNDPQDVANKMKVLIKDEELRIKMGRNARRCAEENFDREKTYQKIITVIEEHE